MKAIIAGAGLFAAATALTATPISISDIAGVYKYRFENGLVDGTNYKSENVLEVVKVSPRQAYVRAYLEFYNGHSCDIWGVAHLEGGALVYRPQENYGENKCELTLQQKGDRIVFGDANSACKYQYCGMRGSFNNLDFALSSRRPIRYMPRLLASRQYAEAMSEVGLASPPPKVSIKLEPMLAEGRVARYPRLSVFPDKAIRAKFNALMAKAEAASQSDRDDCVASLSPDDAKAFRIDMRVTYVTARYVNVTFAANRRCPSALAAAVADPSTVDLSTVEYLNWELMFKQGFFHGPHGEQDGRLAALYRERFTSSPIECRKALEKSGALVLWLDARKGLMVRTQMGLPEGCDQDMALSPKDIAPYVQDARLLADLNATVQNQD